MFLGGMNPNPPGTIDPVIPTNKYRYLSYRMLQEGQEDVERGWLTRVGWWQVNAQESGVNQPAVMSRPVMTLEGWQTYKIDLWSDEVVDPAYDRNFKWLNAQPNRLRLDPGEHMAELLPGAFHVDWIKLTAMEEVARGATYPIKFSLQAAQPQAEISFYYDTDTDPGNGRTLIATRSLSPQAVAPEAPAVAMGTGSAAAPWRYKVYLPRISSNRDGATVYNWNTANVNPGTYFVCANTHDGLNSTYGCSEAPLVVR